MKTIPLTQGQVALVDDADFDAVNAFKWHAEKRGRRVYAARNHCADGVRRIIRLHNFLMPEAGRIDHKNGQGLDNQRHNLRPASQRQNQQAFQRKKAGASSKFRGVYWDARRKNWVAQIGIDDGKKHLGAFGNERDAALAYDAGAREYFNEFAAPNFPLAVPPPTDCMNDPEAAI